VRQSPLELWPALDLRPSLHGGSLDAWGVDLDGGIWLAERLSGDDVEGGAGLTYHIVAVRGGRKELDITIGEVPFAIDFVQPLGGTILLAASRQQFRSPAPIPGNGLVYTREGAPVRQFGLGDGIEDIQTRGREIWVGYFDEGVFGGTVARHGLVCFDRHGVVRYRFAPPPGVEGISDCYAFNVMNASDVYLCYYTPFEIVMLHTAGATDPDPGVITAGHHWHSPIRGSHTLATDGTYLLADGGYDDHNRFVLLALAARQEANLLGSIQPVSRAGRPFASTRNRGQVVYLNDGERIYALELYAAVGTLGA
jgi:outer membrane protein assembly factor BamB